jgi:hypothetical protein
VKARMIVLTLALFTLGLAAGFAAENPNMGTWKLNEAKSKFAPEATKNSTVVYEAAGDGVKVTTDGTTGDGKPVLTEWTGKFDGKDYPVTGGGASDTRSYKKVDDHTMTITNKTAGKVTTSGKITVSADGKSRTVTISGTDSSGKKVSSSAVYDKQ